MADDPNWPRASAWLAGVHEPDAALRLAVLGAPVRLGSISGGRFDLAPAAIRDALARFSTWAYTHQIDIRSVAAQDLGDLPLADTRPEEALEPLSDQVRRAIEGRDAVVILGGDNSITRPGVHGLGLPLDRVGLVTVDAHLDLRDLDRGLTNGNPVRALLADGLPGRNVVHIGIQPFANSSEYIEVANEADTTWIPAGHVHSDGIRPVLVEELDNLAARADAVYVDLDLDVLDRAYAPACPGARPGGLEPGDVLEAAEVAGLHPAVRAMDIVEVDPTQDVADVTLLTAASCLLSFAAGLAGRGAASP
jgi:formiminoglutamase